MASNGLNTDGFVVGIGASAGGLEAIHELFDHLPSNSGMSFIVIQHLSPDHKSLLVELLGRHTEMEVKEAENDIEIEKDTVYVIPNNKLITLEGNKLKLSDKEQSKGPSTAIDNFLFSLADEKAGKAIGIILSGTGTDGSKGLQAIKEAGGLTLVQDPATAKFDGMPNSAIVTGMVDVVLPPFEMPKQMELFVSKAGEHLPMELDIPDEQLNELFTLVMKNTGCDFQYYKTPTIARRISRRMNELGIRSISAYISLLKRSTDECKTLSNDFLINVTRFFRDEPAFQSLQKDVLPNIVASKEEGEVLKVWVAACSTGEEAYTIAILIDRYLQSIHKQLNVKIFATDLDGHAISIASKGVYASHIEQDIPAEILSDYFSKEGDKYVVVPYLRKQIVFAAHNILKDPPFIKNDLVTCRNMLIYMTPALQKKVLASLYFSLNKAGYLFLGSSETLNHLADKMQEVNGRWKIYQKIHDGYSLPGPSEVKPDVTMKASQPRSVTRKKEKSLVEDFQEVLAEELGYAAIYIDRNYEVKEATGNFKKYLSLPDKLISLNLLKMLPQDVSVLLSTTLRKSLKDETREELKNIRLMVGNSRRFINVIVKPPNAMSSHFLLVFSETVDKAIHDVQPDPQNGHVQYNGLVEELEHELKETRLNLQTAIEELETTNEELQSSNEELISSNEELQSTNEQLQSLNEELHTLNTEHQLKIKELIELNNDLDNYFRSTDMGQIFLDTQLRIRKFNPAAVKLINLIESDIGRPIDHVSTNILHENLLADVQQVKNQHTSIEKEVTLRNGTSCLLRIVPYLMHDKKPFGVVISFVDISVVKDLNNLLKGVFNASLSAVLALKVVRNVSQQVTDFTIIAANHCTRHLLGKNHQTLEGTLLKTALPELVDHGYFEELVRVVASGDPTHIDYNINGNGSMRRLQAVGVKMEDGLVLSLTDVADKKEAEEGLQRNFLELAKPKEELRELNKSPEAQVLERTREQPTSARRLSEVVQATKEPCWQLRQTDNSVWCSDSFYERFGYTPGDETNSRNFWMSKIHPDDRNSVVESIFQVINKHQDTWTSEYRLQKADGSYANILDRGFLLKDENNVPFRMVGSMLDVTELRLAETEVVNTNEKSRFVAETIPLIVWTADDNGMLDFVNTNYVDYTGNAAETAYGDRWKALVHKNDIDQLEKAFAENVQQASDFSVEMRLLRKDKVYRWNLLRARVRKDAFGRVLMWVGTIADIHEQKLATRILEKRVEQRTRQLQEVIQELEHSNSSLQQFAYVASHDLKEPLRKIQMFSVLVKERYLDGADNAAINYIDRVIASADRMTRLINDLLNFSRLSSHNAFERTDMNALLQEVISDLEYPIKEKGAEVRCTGIPSLDVIPAQMRQVLQNLLSNSIKFSKPGVKPLIEISARLVNEKSFDAKTSNGGAYCHIDIRDNGIGFQEQYTPKIFLIFQRLHTREQHEGTGIGLAIAKKIVERHDGIITANSQEMKGSTFSIILPVQQQKPAMQAVPL